MGGAPGIGRRGAAARAAAVAALLATAGRAEAQGPAAEARAAGARAAKAPAAAVTGQVPVAARALPRGHVLAADDIAYAPAASTPVVSATSPVPGPRPPAPGWTTRRVISAGEVLRAPAVAPPAAVRAGDVVALVYQADGITLRLAGTAAADAPLGGRVPVRVDTRRRFEGVVAGPGVVRLP